MGAARFGDSPAEVAKVFGKPQGAAPTAHSRRGRLRDIGAPGTYAFPKPCDRDHGGPDDGTSRESASPSCATAGSG